MYARSKSHGALAASAAAIVIAGSLWAAPAEAQMFREPFTFSQRNQAGMAVFMRQQSNSGSNSDAVVAGSATSQTLVCAGAGDTTATAAGNIMCVVAGDGTNVIVNSNQDSQGNQTADANTTQTAADTIQSILNGETAQ